MPWNVRETPMPIRKEDVCLYSGEAALLRF